MIEENKRLGKQSFMSTLGEDRAKREEKEKECW